MTKPLMMPAVGQSRCWKLLQRALWQQPLPLLAVLRCTWAVYVEGCTATVECSAPDNAGFPRKVPLPLRMLQHGVP